MRFLCILYSFLFCCAFASAQTLPTEDDYFKIITLPVPEGVKLEVGGLTTLPNGNIAVSTRRGEVWTIENPYLLNGTMPHYQRFASGLHEILGLAYKDGSLYCAQRGELTKLSDRNGDGRADRYETVYAWPLSGHYHEYSFGPKIAPDGSFFVTANVAFGNIEWWRGESRVPWRGWTMHITPDGKMEPWATGMRSPCGIGMINGEFFYADNQGDWVGSGALVQVNKGDFTGHPAGLRWSGLPESPVKVRLEDIYSRVDPRLTPPGGVANKPENIADEMPKPLFEVAKEVPGIKLPAVFLPHGILGQSTSEIVEDTTGGSFGPFAGQLFIGDQAHSKISRVFLEKVKGIYQGASFAFREGFQSGVLRMCWGRDGSMFVGQTNRGWGSTGKDPYGLQRLLWTGETPFEMKAVRAMPDGFEIEFTQPVDKKSAADLESYKITGFIYKYHPVYGSPIVNDKSCPVWGAVVSKDGLKVRIVVDSLREFYIHEIKVEGVRSYQDNNPLLHNTAYYTLNAIPDGDKLNIPRPAPKPVKAEADMSGMQHHMKMGVARGEPEPVEEKAEKKKTVTTAKSMAKRTLKKPADWEKIDQTISLGTKPGLKYDQTLITVKAESRVKWTFTNKDDMPHNCAIVQPGSADDVGNLSINLGLKGEKQSYIPNTPKILFHTRLMPPGTTESIYFYAPATPGDYTFVCTVPGHSQIMRGVLRVVK